MGDVSGCWYHGEPCVWPVVRGPEGPSSFGPEPSPHSVPRAASVAHSCFGAGLANGVFLFFPSCANFCY